MIVRRIVANIIDLFVLIASIAIGVYLGAMVMDMFEEPFFLLTVSVVCIIILVPIALQSLFWLEGTTIGKMFVFIKVVNQETGEKLDYFQMLVRDLSKILSVNLTTLPVFVGKVAVHDVILNSKVIIKPKEATRKGGK